MFLKLSRRILLTGLLLLVCMHVNADDHVASPASAINMVDYFKVLLGLAFVIALFLGSTFLFKRYGNGAMTGRGQIRLVDGLHLGNRERLVLVEVNDKQLLLSITAGQISKLDTIDKPLMAENTNA
ncbi:MAG: flagellar biosynthetic protein FliO [Gammaproteobacteria bacterium]|jgi:flagellar biosynthetic protein FliO